MQKLKLAIKVLNSKTKVKKNLIKIANDNKFDISLEKDVNRKPTQINSALFTLISLALVQRFMEPDSTEKGQDIFDIFNEILRNCKEWVPALKLLYVAHELMNNVGPQFCRSFLSEHFERISDIKPIKGNDIGK